MLLEAARSPTASVLATSNISLGTGHSIRSIDPALGKLAMLLVIADHSVRDDIGPLPFWPLGIGVVAINCAALLIPT